MPSYPSSLTFKRNIQAHVWQQLAELWLGMAARDETQLFTEDTLIKLLESPAKKHISQQLENRSIILLITAKFNALLYREPNIADKSDRVSLILEPTEIIDKLVLFAHKQQWDISLINHLQASLTTKLDTNQDSIDLVSETFKLLIDRTEQADRERYSHSTPEMEKLLQYQVEQERIFEQIEIQIGQNLIYQRYFKPQSSEAVVS